MRVRGIFLVPILLAAALRFPDLADRPMHADEAIHADKFSTLLEGGGYAYDPQEYHGPTLYYLTLPFAWLRGQRSYVEVDEVTLRAVPAVLGVLLVAAHLQARAVLGGAGALAAALLTALSPAFVYYSRYFIHEMALVLWSFGLLLAALRFLEAPGTGAALVAGGCVGLMLATKETAVLALLSLVVAFGSAVALPGGTEGLRARLGRALPVRSLVLALLVALGVAALFFSSFLSHPRGVVDAARAYAVYLDRAQAASWHVHAWSYYFGLLLRFPSSGTPFWTEGVILLLAAVGLFAAVAGRGGAFDVRAVRCLGVYTLVMAGLYAAIPYKTPWCLLGFHHGFVLLAGAGTAYLLERCRTRPLRGLLAIGLAAGLLHLGVQAFEGSRRYAADPRNPWVYAHTSRDVFEITDRVIELSHLLQRDGPVVRVQVASPENVWPLPFYLRGVAGVEWWNGVRESEPAAPLVLLTPDQEPALLKALYELPPPGERELYVSLFDRPLELRPGVEMRGYVANRLLEESLRP